jgi:chaperone modulatory protein CbpM
MVDITLNVAEGATLFTLGDVCQRCGVHAEIIIEMVEHGVVEPASTDTNKRWLFDGNELLRLRRAQRLRRDLQLNLPGVALSMDLLDEVERLQQQIASLQHQLQRVHSGEELSYAVSGVD